MTGVGAMTYNAELYMHDLDRKAFDALNLFPQFVKLQKAYITNVDEKAAKIEFMSSAIRLSDKQMPEIYALLPPICGKLGINVPDLYMVQSKNKKDLNAFTGGITSPFVCVTSELVKQMPTQMVASILAHECGHISCKHYLYHSMARNFANGIEASPLAMIPAIRKYLSRALITALLFWDRCSELSADRAAVLCDEDAGKTIDALLKVHGFEDNINREEFIKQALDLKAFINDSQANKMMEQMIVQWDSHPLLATRAYECYDWAQSERFKGILEGTISVDADQTAADNEETEVIAAEMSSVGAASSGATEDTPPEVVDALNKRLQQLDHKLERYTNHADRADYALAVASGLLAGLIDSLFVGELSLDDANQWGNEKAEKLVVKVAKTQGYRGTDTANAVKYLEDMFPIAADKATNDFGGGLQHHLRDFSHHPTPIGLACSIITQFTGKVYGTDVTGAFQAVVLNEDGLTLVGKNFPEKITFGVVNWIFHMVSDVAGSSGSIMKGSFGTGLPGPLVSFVKELSALPIFQKTNDKGYKELSVYISKLFNGTLLGRRDEEGRLIPLKFDLRTELGVTNQIGKQAIPVLINECVVRAIFFVRRLLAELSREYIVDWGDLDKVNWSKTIPAENRTIDRMLTISSLAFTVADTTDAAIRAAIESGGNWIIFSGRFVARYNYIGAGRTAIAIVKEFSNEKKEAQLIHERMLLMDAKATIMFEQLQQFKAQLDEKLAGYLIEDIEAFMEGFDDINEGLATNNSDLAIRGNITIQRVLGRAPQFTNQKEFDDLMESDIPLQL